MDKAYYEQIERDIDDAIERKREAEIMSIMSCRNCRSEAVLLHWRDNGDIEVACSRCGTVGVRRR